MSSDEGEYVKEIDIVIIPRKMNILTDDKAVNKDSLFHDPGIPKDVPRKIEVHDDK